MIPNFINQQGQNVPPQPMGGPPQGLPPLNYNAPQVAAQNPQQQNWPPPIPLQPGAPAPAPAPVAPPLPQGNNLVRFQQLQNVHPEVQNHAPPRHFTQQELLYQQMLRSQTNMTSYEHSYAQRAKQNSQPAHLRSQLHSVNYQPPYQLEFDPITQQTVRRLENTSLEDNLLAYISDDTTREMYSEPMFTKQQRKLLTKLNFNELKKQSLKTLHDTAKDKFVHSLGVHIVCQDLIFRVLEEKWVELSDVLSHDEKVLLAAVRSVILSVDDGCYTTATKAETNLLKLSNSLSKQHYPLKRQMISTFKSRDPLVALQSKFPLQSTSRRHIDPVAQITKVIADTPNTLMHPTSEMAQQMLNQLPKKDGSM